tara:strand:+ start:314 stop:610 length:297 start_codon:yes stop_codon:yes gene_type:complete
MAFKMKAGSEGPFKKNYPSVFKTHEGPDKPHKQSKISKLVEKGVEKMTLGGIKAGLGPIGSSFVGELKSGEDLKNLPGKITSKIKNIGKWFRNKKQVN